MVDIAWQLRGLGDLRFHKKNTPRTYQLFEHRKCFHHTFFCGSVDDLFVTKDVTTTSLQLMDQNLEASTIHWEPRTPGSPNGWVTKHKKLLVYGTIWYYVVLVVLYKCYSTTHVLPVRAAPLPLLPPPTIPPCTTTSSSTITATHHQHHQHPPLIIKGISIAWTGSAEHDVPYKQHIVSYHPMTKIPRHRPGPQQRPPSHLVPSMECQIHRPHHMKVRSMERQNSGKNVQNLATKNRSVSSFGYQNHPIKVAHEGL